MRISFSPQSRDGVLVVSKSGDVLTINGEDVDFSVIPDGSSLDANFDARAVENPFVVGTVERVDGDLRIELLLPHGPNPEQWQAFPDPITDVPDGPVDLPVDTTVEVTVQNIEGGINVTTTTRRWQRPDEVTVEFTPYPEPEPEEPANGND